MVFAYIFMLLSCFFLCYVNENSLHNKNLPYGLILVLYVMQIVFYSKMMHLFDISNHENNYLILTL